MANYEYLDKDEYRTYIVKRAKATLLYRSNLADTKELTTILNYLFDDAYSIIVKWRKLKTDDEFLSQKWDGEITDYVVDSYRRMGDETLESSNINGVNKKYKISPEGRLKTRIPQVM